MNASGKIIKKFNKYNLIKAAYYFYICLYLRIL